jgi:hypothetical protein
MKRVSSTVVLSLTLFGSAAFARPSCPPREAGSAYPWQNFQPMRGDQQTVVYIDVDKTGRLLKCALAKNNIPDPETRFRLCKTYMEDWHASAAASGEPASRRAGDKNHPARLHNAWERSPARRPKGTQAIFQGSS